MRIALIAAAFGLVLSGACDRPREPFHSERLLAMATWVELVFEAPDPERAAAVVADVERMLRSFERDYYAWADGELAHLNAALARGERLRVDPKLAALLLAAREYGERSGRTFDPAVGDIVELWGFHSEAAPPQPPPSAADVAAWVGRDTGIRHLTIAADGTIAAARPPGKLDLGGIAKGEAVDRILAQLSAAGVSDALVNAGGDVRVSGSRGGRAWRIGIQKPRGDGILGLVALASGEAVFTSGDYERFFEVDGQRMHHIIDPATGFPVGHTQAVTVIADGGVAADAAATALLVAGPERWLAVAKNLGVSHALRVDATGAIEMTASMRDRFQALGSADTDIIAASSKGGSH